jgi:hypothetical protein
MVFSLGSNWWISAQMDVPPIPESKIPIGLLFSIETKLIAMC